MPTVVARERFRLSEERYREFADAYGFDVRTWAGYPVLREIRELTMTTWLMQNVGESAAAAAEFALRVVSLRTPMARQSTCSLTHLRRPVAPRANPPICADIASMPVRTLPAHIWMFRAA
jgi:hypothetical protein